MKLNVLIICLFISTNVFSQSERIANDFFLYWLYEPKVEFSDFQKEVDSAEYKKYNLISLPNVQIHCVLDYPKKIRKLKTLGEKWYIAPVFCIKCSAMQKQDSMELAYAQMYFDIAELCSRVTRKKIEELQSQFKEIDFDKLGAIAATFPRIVEDMYDSMRKAFDSFTIQVVIDKKEGSYDQWRKLIDEGLEDYERYSTSRIECERFLNEKPFSEEYMVSYEKWGRH